MDIVQWLAMGGHWPYVWGSYGLALVLMAWEVFQVVQRRRRVREEGERLLFKEKEA